MVESLSRLHHNNLVRLMGYCIEAEFVLIYEYMAKGSLFDSLNGRGETLVVWQDRIRIAVEVAEGLEYLHNHCTPSIIHSNIRSSNILLDKNLVGRISDIGISAMADNPGHVAVRNHGYIDPVCSENEIATRAADVYAFGVVLLEIITGKPPIIQQMGRNEKPLSLSKWAKRHIERGDLSVILDPALSDDMNELSLWTVIEIAMRCMDSEREKRPTIDKVKEDLLRALYLEKVDRG